MDILHQEQFCEFILWSSGCVNDGKIIFKYFEKVKYAICTRLFWNKLWVKTEVSFIKIMFVKKKHCLCSVFKSALLQDEDDG